MSVRELDLSLEELRVRREQTRDNICRLAGQLAELIEDGPFDACSVGLHLVLAHDLRLLLWQERRLRRAIKVEVAG